MQYKIELANLNNIDSILDLYMQRMQWFKENNIKQWSMYLENHPKSEFIEVINNNNYYIIKNQDNEIVAGFELSTNSKYWNDNSTESYYIYKVVTKVGYKNIGKLIFERCKEIARADGKQYLRLNCVKSNSKLNDIYEKYNFKLIGYINDGFYNYSLREFKVY